MRSGGMASDGSQTPHALLMQSNDPYTQVIGESLTLLPKENVGDMGLATFERLSTLDLSHARQQDVFDEFLKVHDSRISHMRSYDNKVSDSLLEENIAMPTFSSRFKTRRKELGLRQDQLAKKAGVSQTTISDIERGRNDGSRELVALSKALKCRAEWLATGEGEKELGQGANIFWPDPNTSEGPEPTGLVPLISWVQAGLFCSSPDLLQPGDAEDWFPAFKKMGPHSYALRVSGDSMTSHSPGVKSYPAGTIIYVDPDKAVVNGSKVVARIHDNETATFKVYSEDAGKRFLKPLNTQYPTIEMTEDMQICGVVVGSYSED